MCIEEPILSPFWMGGMGTRKTPNYGPGEDSE